MIAHETLAAARYTAAAFCELVKIVTSEKEELVFFHSKYMHVIPRSVVNIKRFKRYVRVARLYTSRDTLIHWL